MDSNLARRRRPAPSAAALCRCVARRRSANTPTNDAPNPYTTIENHFKLPEGRTWGSTSAVDIDPDGKSIWVAERCGANTCYDRAKAAMSPLPVILKFDESGKLVRSFGTGIAVFPHGIHVDRDGNVWITDGQDNIPRRAPDAPRRLAAAAGAGQGRRPPGLQVQPRRQAAAHARQAGRQPARASRPTRRRSTSPTTSSPTRTATSWSPRATATPRRPPARLIRFDKSGKFLREFGKMGTGPQGEFMQPHGLAFDSRGRLFVADRSNNRIQILDAESYKTLDTWYQFSRLSGIFIDKNDMIYGADSESGSVNPPHGAWRRGMRIGSAKDGKVIAFIPDPTSVGETFSMVDGKPVMKKADGSPGATGTLAAEGVAVDAAGNIYGAEVGPRAVKKYVKK